MNKRAYIIVFLSCFTVLTTYGGGVNKWVAIDKNAMARDMMRLTKRFQHMKKYEVQVMHASYDSYTTTVSHESSKGYFKRDNKSYHNFLLGIHTIQNNGCRLVIDSAKKVMMLADPTDANDSIMPVSDYSTLYGLCSSIKRSTEGNQTIYRLEFDKKYSMAAMEFTVKDSLPQKIVMYYSKPVKSGNSMNKPRLEIDYTNWSMSVPDLGTAFNVAEYLEKNGGGYAVRSSYKRQYKLLDERVLTKNVKK